MAKDYFLKTEHNTKLSTADLKEPVKEKYHELFSPLGCKFSRIYFGWKNGKPLVWRVLAIGCKCFNGEKYPRRKTLLIDCDSVISKSIYDSKITGTGKVSRWRNSFLNGYLNGEFYADNVKVTKFIAQSYKREPNGLDNKSPSYKFEPLDGETFFVLDCAEISNKRYYCEDGGLGTPDPQFAKKYENKVTNYWLRSYYKDDEAVYRYFFNHGNGDDSQYETAEKSTSLGVSPACNIDMSCILLSSEVDYGYYKLTFIDESRTVKLDSRKKAEVKGNTVYLNYVVSGAEDSNALALMILDKNYTSQNTNNASILYYEQVDLSCDKNRNGKAEFYLPGKFNISDWGDQYRVYMMVENANWDYESDYASKPVEIKSSDIGIDAYTVSFDLGERKGNVPAAQKVSKGGCATEPEYIEVDGYYVEGWYDGKTSFGFSTPVNKNYKLVAKWEKAGDSGVWVDGRYLNTKRRELSLHQGKVTYNPGTQTLRFTNAVVTRTSKTKKGRTAGIYVLNKAVTITGDVDIYVPNADHSIFVEKTDLRSKPSITFGASKEATSVSILGTKYAIMAERANVVFSSGNVIVKTSSKRALAAVGGGKMIVEDDVSLISPRNSFVRRNGDDSVLYEADGRTPATTACIVGHQEGVYDIWVGESQVNFGKPKKIKCDEGEAEFDPKTRTLTFYNATIRNGYQIDGGRCVGIYSRNENLTIKGDLTIDNPSLEAGIRCDDFAVSDSPLKIEGNIKISAGMYGIQTHLKDVTFGKGNFDIKTSDDKGAALYVNGKIDLTSSGAKISTPSGGVVKKDGNSEFSAVYSTPNGKKIASNVVIKA